MTKAQIESKYKCTCFKQNGFDDSRKFWVALPIESENKIFDYADGWTLGELLENIKAAAQEPKGEATT